MAVAVRWCHLQATHHTLRCGVVAEVVPNVLHHCQCQSGYQAAFAVGHELVVHYAGLPARNITAARVNRDRPVNLTARTELLPGAPSPVRAAARSAQDVLAHQRQRVQRRAVEVLAGDLSRGMVWGATSLSVMGMEMGMEAVSALTWSVRSETTCQMSSPSTSIDRTICLAEPSGLVADWNCVIPNPSPWTSSCRIVPRGVSAASARYRKNGLVFHFPSKSCDPTVPVDQAIQHLSQKRLSRRLSQRHIGAIFAPRHTSDPPPSPLSCPSARCPS